MRVGSFEVEAIKFSLGDIEAGLIFVISASVEFRTSSLEELNVLNCDSVSFN